MLQQTQVETVKPYFERFMNRFPTIQHLADAPEAELMRFWAGLGYYSRARNLHRAARRVAEEMAGVVPRTVEDLSKLPGIGRYTAGAIASIGYDDPAPILDGNVMRVLSRMLLVRGDPRDTPANAILWRAAEELVKGQQPGMLNEALMELGALVCVSGAPRCGECPVEAWCQARAHGLQSSLPERRAPPTVTDRQHVALVVRSEDHVMLVRQPETLWKGLWTFPTDFPNAPQSTGPGIGVEKLCDDLGLSDHPARPVGSIRHSVMNWRIRLLVDQIDVEDPRPDTCSRGEWVPVSSLGDAAMPSPHRRIARMISDVPAQRALDF